MWRRGERCLILAVTAAALLAAAATAARDERLTYIVHMSHSAMPNDFVERQVVRRVAAVGVGGRHRLYTYDTLVHGFSARLTRAEAEAMEAQPGVLLVNPEVRYELHTTRTPEFLGLDGTDALFPQSSTSSDVTIRVLDTCVWPERTSYDDTGCGPVPAGWKGKCEEGRDFNASAYNKKLIGTRFFLTGYEAAKGPIDVSKESRSPRDNDGHGTHTSSTAAGGAVQGADLLGYASGTVKGMAPRARVATYKVCWAGECFSSYILKAMEV